MTLEQMKKRKEELGYSNEAVSLLSGVPLSTVNKIFSGRTPSPRYNTLLALERALAPSSGTSFLKDSQDAAAWHINAEAASEADADYRTSGFSAAGAAASDNQDEGMSPARLWARQGTYTLKDYLALPDDVRVELIDGVFYDMSSPSNAHQLIAGEIYRILANYLRGKKGPCTPFIAPADVQLDCDDRTIVQPDVFVVCDRKQIPRNRVMGAPDLAIEILSPSTKNKDLTIKSGKYMKAGVREYWIVDPLRQKVMVFTFENRSYQNVFLYGFDQKVPVRIFGGDCEVDFADIKEYVGFLLDDPEEES